MNSQDYNSKTFSGVFKHLKYIWKYYSKETEKSCLQCKNKTQVIKCKYCKHEFILDAIYNKNYNNIALFFEHNPIPLEYMTLVQIIEMYDNYTFLRASPEKHLKKESLIVIKIKSWLANSIFYNDIRKEVCKKIFYTIVPYIDDGFFMNQKFPWWVYSITLELTNKLPIKYYNESDEMVNCWIMDMKEIPDNLYPIVKHDQCCFDEYGTQIMLCPKKLKYERTCMMPIRTVMPLVGLNLPIYVYIEIAKWLGDYEQDVLYNKDVIKSIQNIIDTQKKRNNDNKNN